MKAVCVYCGSRAGIRPAYLDQARALGNLLGARGITLVYGGGNVGLMGAVADATHAAGGKTIGVIPRRLVEKEVAHLGVGELLIVNDMHERKLKMATLSDAFIALPGGIGTMEELFEVWTWLQLGFHTKPIGLLDAGNYYAKLCDFLDHMVAEGFLNMAQRQLLHRSSDPAALLEELDRFSAPATDPWYDEVRFV